MTDHVVATTDEIDDGDRVVVQIEGTEIGVFQLGDEYRAFANWCPHQGGPVCEGLLTGRQTATFDPESLEVGLEWTAEDRVLACPWHSWEFDVESGRIVSGGQKALISHPVRIEDDDIIVSL